MKSIDLFIFDLDGTLADTGQDIAEAVNHALAILGLSPLEKVQILRYVGDGIGCLIRRCLGNAHAHLQDKALELFKNHYENHLLDNTVLYEGVRESLAYFQNKIKAVLSNKSHLFVVKVLEGLGIAHFFDVVIGGDVYPYRKPDARLIEPILTGFGVGRRDAVIVGDGCNDLLLARNAGIVSCAFLNGLTDREALLALEPDFTCENMGELTRLFY